MFARKHGMDLTQGSVLKQLLIFAIPIILTNVLQQLYHSADMIVVGNFARDSTTALAAVGSTGSITALCLNLFVGLSVGANVVCAHLFGAQKKEELRRAMYTSILLAAFSGIVIGILGFVFSRTLLEWMGSPENVIDQATLYMQIIFLGQPGSLVYNFGAGILRSHGDTKRPMYILTATGLVNVVLNLVFVIVFHLDAAGVAIATVTSHYLSAIAVLWILFSPHGEFCLSVSELSLDRKEAGEIAKVGIPSGLNGMVFSLSNVIIVTALNSLGDTVLAANSAAHNVDAMLYQILLSFYTACISFSGQNYGAKKLDRIDRLLGSGILLASAFVVVADGLLFLFPEGVMRLFSSDPEVIRLGVSRLYIVCGLYLVYISSEISIGCMRGMGKSVLPSVLNVICICVPRIIWVLWIFPLRPDYSFLLWCYPISWACSGIAQLFCYFYYRRKIRKELPPLSPEASASGTE